MANGNSTAFLPFIAPILQTISVQRLTYTSDEEARKRMLIKDCVHATRFLEGCERILKRISSLNPDLVPFFLLVVHQHWEVECQEIYVVGKCFAASGEEGLQQPVSDLAAAIKTTERTLTARLPPSLLEAKANEVAQKWIAANVFEILWGAIISQNRDRDNFQHLVTSDLLRELQAMRSFMPACLEVDISSNTLASNAPQWGIDEEETDVKSFEVAAHMARIPQKVMQLWSDHRATLENIKLPGKYKAWWDKKQIQHAIQKARFEDPQGKFLRYCYGRKILTIRPRDASHMDQCAGCAVGFSATSLLLPNEDTWFKYNHGAICAEVVGYAQHFTSTLPLTPETFRAERDRIEVVRLAYRFDKRWAGVGEARAGDGGGSSHNQVAAEAEDVDGVVVIAKARVESVRWEGGSWTLD